MSDEPMPPGVLRALKIAVVVMGVLIVAGVILLIVLIVQRASSPEAAETADGRETAEDVAETSGAVAPSDLVALPGDPTVVPLGLPAGSRIRSVTDIAGWLGVLVRVPAGDARSDAPGAVRTAPAGSGQDRLYLIDPQAPSSAAVVIPASDL